MGERSGACGEEEEVSEVLDGSGFVLDPISEPLAFFTNVCIGCVVGGIDGARDEFSVERPLNFGGDDEEVFLGELRPVLVFFVFVDDGPHSLSDKESGLHNFTKV